ncbi:unnamed protein product [Linum trigynum]|uniref:Uncharacterized protein n=1 Tax=Linum trigynum TaxID=586398 RepID=A0AAV2E4E9_9ROSI
MIVTKKSRRNYRDNNRNWKEENDVGKSSQGNGGKLGKNGSKGKESVGRSPSPQILVGQQTSTPDAKFVAAEKRKEEIKKGKEKLGSPPSSSGKGLLGPGLAPTLATGLKPNNGLLKASSSSAPFELPRERQSEPPKTERSAHIAIPQALSSLPVQTTIGPNGTNIQLVTIQQPSFKPKSQIATSPTPTTQGKQKGSKSSKSRSRKLSPIKNNHLKPLQIWSPMKEKKSKAKSRLATLTLQDIHAWTKGGKEVPTAESMEEQTSADDCAKSQSLEAKSAIILV